METRKRLYRLAKANYILGYITIALIILIAVLFALSIQYFKQIDPKDIPATFILLIFGTLIVLGLVSSLVLASLIIGIIEICIAKKLGTLGQIKPQAVMGTIITADIVSIVGSIIGICLDAQEIAYVAAFDVGLWICIALTTVGCLTQTIFNTIYASRVKGPKLKKSH